MDKDKNLLKEAIADAKVLKQTAISNAKAALEESLTPHLKSMFENKLKEMDEDEEGELDLVLEEDDEETEEETTETEETETEEETEETETEETEEEEINIEDMSEEDLKNFVESVIQDMVEAGELEGAKSEEEEEVMEPQDDESDLEFEIEDDEMGEDEEVDVDALISEIKKHRKLRETHMRKKAPKKIKESRMKKRVPRKPSSNLVKENLELKRQLRKFKELNESLKRDFSEVNLLNAKLLYTNKIFKTQTLSEGQKLDVLDNFDKATSIKEVKLIYETLISSYDKKSLRKKPIKEQLGMASKSIKSPTRLKEQKATTQEDPMVSRFKKLAGLDSE